MRIGFVGTGHITSAMVEGLCTCRHPPNVVLVSPRNAANAQQLSTRHARVKVAPENQSVLDGSDIVVLAVLPTVAPSILTPLAFRPDHLVVSVVAMLSLSRTRDLVTPAEAVVRAVPLPSVASHQGPIAYFPDEPRVRTLWAMLGTPIPVGSEDELHALWSLTAMISPYYGLMEEIGGWCKSKGVGSATVGRFVGALFLALAAGVKERPGDVGALAAGAATPGGLNAQARDFLQRAGVHAAYRRALEEVWARLSGAS